MRTTEQAHPRGHAGPPFEIVAIGASAGGITALLEVIHHLPAGFRAVVVVVQHLDPRHHSLMPEIFGRRSALPVHEGAEGMALKAGHVYLAPPDRHMLVNGDATISLTQTELVNFVRPSADLLFESVAAAYGDRAIAAVLTGAGKDGSMGVTAIKKRGGTVIVQDAASSQFASMPLAALKTGAVDFVLALDDIAGALVNLVAGGVGD